MPIKPPTNLRSVDALVAIMRDLRAPYGCPWDQEQTFETIAPYTIEEAYEVAEAIDQGDLGALKVELGDLLFQVVYHARLAEEAGAFRFDDVVEAIADKLIRRHPHVFGDTEIGSSEAQTKAWEELKAAERGAAGHESVLDDVPHALPALARADKLMRRAARVGFFWDEMPSVVAKIREETEELIAEVERGDEDKARDEFGDTLFVLANLGRRLGIDPEEALRRSNAKFERRFRHMEDWLRAEGRQMSGAPIDELLALWDEAKQRLG
jgi:ATP diphosphatase